MNILKLSLQLIYGKKMLPIPSCQKLSSSLSSKHSPHPPKAAMDSWVLSYQIFCPSVQ